MKAKKLFIAGLSMIIVNMPLSAFAGIVIENNTRFDSTSIINNGMCSNVFAEKGIARAGQSLPVDDSLIRLACLTNLANCTADVYMTSNCSGTKVGTVTFDINTGTKSVKQNPVSPFKITSAIGSYKFTLSGGPTLTNQ